MQHPKNAEGGRNMAAEEVQQCKSVVDQVMDGIIRQIISGELVPGGKLPTEMELCRQFGAGRMDTTSK